MTMQQKSLDIKLKVCGPDHLDVAKTQNNITIIFDQQGKYLEALEMYQKSLATKEKVLRPEHNANPQVSPRNSDHCCNSDH